MIWLVSFQRNKNISACQKNGCNKTMILIVNCQLDKLE